jgi:hypothetical protein
MSAVASGVGGLPPGRRHRYSPLSTTWPDFDHADRHELHGAWRWRGW